MKDEIGFENRELIMSPDFNIFDQIKEFEILLIKSNVLENNSKNGYIKLIKKKISKNLFDEISIKTKKNNPYYYNLQNGVYLYMFYDSCPASIIKTEKASIEFYPTKAIYEKIFQEGYPKKYILNELLLKTNFKNDTSRLLLCNLIFLNWKNEFEK